MPIETIAEKIKRLRSAQWFQERELRIGELFEEIDGLLKGIDLVSGDVTPFVNAGRTISFMPRSAETEEDE